MLSQMHSNPRPRTRPEVSYHLNSYFYGTNLNRGNTPRVGPGTNIVKRQQAKARIRQVAHAIWAPKGF